MGYRWCIRLAELRRMDLSSVNFYNNQIPEQAHQLPIKQWKGRSFCLLQFMHIPVIEQSCATGENHWHQPKTTYWYCVTCNENCFCKQRYHYLWKIKVQITSHLIQCQYWISSADNSLKKNPNKRIIFQYVIEDTKINF